MGTKMKKILNKFLTWLYYLDCKTEAEKQKKWKRDIDMAVWQFNVFTR